MIYEISGFYLIFIYLQIKIDNNKKKNNRTEQKMTDSDFIAGLYNGNHKRLRQLVSMNCISSSTEDIDDCVEEVFVVVVKNVGKIKQHPNKEAWLSMVAKNVTENFNRKFINNLNKAPLYDNEMPVDEYVINKLENERIKKKVAVMRLLGSLSDDYKKIYFLRYSRELSYNKISEITGICLNTVGTKISRLNKLLRSEIEKTVNNNENQGKNEIKQNLDHIYYG